MQQSHMTLSQLFEAKPGVFFPPKGGRFLPTTPRHNRPNARGPSGTRAWKWTEERKKYFLQTIHCGGIGYIGQFSEENGKTWDWVAQQMLDFAIASSGVGGWVVLDGTPEQQHDEMVQKCKNYWSDAKKQNSPQASRRYSAMLRSAYGGGEWNTRYPVRWRDIHQY
tara:strand:- start:31 stop:528 length:498 start_codon:yes stop_codon:yes gene_type:complete